MTETAPTVRRVSRNFGQGDEETFVVSFGKDRTLEVRRLNMGDQFDLAEVMSDSASRLWVSMAFAAASVCAIDGIPVVRPRTRQDLRAVLVRLGDDGVKAVNDALATAEDNRSSDEMEAAMKAQVGNSFETAASAR